MTRIMFLGMVTTIAATFASSSGALAAASSEQRHTRPPLSLVNQRKAIEAHYHLTPHSSSEPERAVTQKQTQRSVNVRAAGSSSSLASR